MDTAGCRDVAQESEGLYNLRSGTFTISVLGPLQSPFWDLYNLRFGTFINLASVYNLGGRSHAHTASDPTGPGQAKTHGWAQNSALGRKIRSM